MYECASFEDAMDFMHVASKHVSEVDHHRRRNGPEARGCFWAWLLFSRRVKSGEEFHPNSVAQLLLLCKGETCGLFNFGFSLTVVVVTVNHVSFPRGKRIENFRRNGVISFVISGPIMWTHFSDAYGYTPVFACGRSFEQHLTIGLRETPSSPPPVGPLLTTLRTCRGATRSCILAAGRLAEMSSRMWGI